MGKSACTCGRENWHGLCFFIDKKTQFSIGGAVMAIVRWKNNDLYDPWETMRNLQDEINHFFDMDRLPAGSGLFDRTNSPPIDVLESGNEFLINCEVPGLEKEDIELSVASQVLTIKGQKKIDTEDREKKYYRRETFSGSFQRTISLPASADPEGIQAELKDGILSVKLPKKKEAIPKQITVKVN
jgi:HSP20 family protein